LSELLTELKRRKVVRVAVVYGATAFAILQAVDLVVAPLQLPAWTMRVLVILVLLGFPVALVLGWAFEVTRSGVRATGETAATGPLPSLLGTRTLMGSGALLLVGVGLGAGWFLKPVPPPADPGSGATDRSIAVMRFADLSPDGSLAYFGDGMAEEILNVLARVPGLRVAGRTSSFSFGGGPADFRAIAEALNVESILQGSIRRSGDRLRVTAQLIRAEDQSQLWSAGFERLTTDDVFDVQDEIARSIVSALELQLSDPEVAALGEWGTRDAAAYHAYLDGRFQWLQRTRAGVLGSIDSYERAIALDPGFARAYAGLADAYAIAANFMWIRPQEAFPLARRAAEQAIGLAPGLADAHVSRGATLHWYYFDYDAAEQSFRRAIELDPRHAFARYWLGILLSVINRPEEALTQVQRARELEPLALQIRAGVGDAYLWSGQPARALEEYQEVFRLDPAFHNSRRWSAEALMELGRPAEALVELDGIPAAWRDLRALRARALAQLGRKAEAEALLEVLIAEATPVPSVEIAYAFAELGRMDDAVRWIRRGIQERDFRAQFIGHTPAGHPLRADARFRQLLREAGLDRYWPEESR
jgi:adenylate cyclase